MNNEMLEKKEEREGDEVLSSILSLEKNISRIKEELKQELSNKDRKHQESVSKTREAVNDLVSEYNKKLLDKDEEIQTIKDSVKSLIKEYDNLIKTKDDHILGVQNQSDMDKSSIINLKSIGVPEQVLFLSKEEILRKMADIIKENLLLTKKVDSQKEQIRLLDMDYDASKVAFEKKSEKLLSEYSSVVEKNKLLEKDILGLKEKMIMVIDETTKAKQSYETNAVNLEAYYKSKIDEVIAEKTREQVELQVSFNMLQKQLETYEQKLVMNELRKDEFLRDVEARIRSAVNPMANEFLKDYGNK